MGCKKSWKKKTFTLADVPVDIRTGHVQNTTFIVRILEIFNCIHVINHSVAIDLQNVFRVYSLRTNYVQFRYENRHGQLGYGLENTWLQSLQGQEIFLFFKTPKPDLRPSQPPIQWASGLFPECKPAGA